MTKSIPLTRGKVALVSDHRYEELSKHKWHAWFDGWNWYAERVEGKRAVSKSVRMHRQIMGVTDRKLHVDHINGDGLDNRDENLRVCTNSQNQRNRGKQKNNVSGYKGVHWNKDVGKYQAQIKINRALIVLGLFPDPAEAARAYDEAARRYHGEFARTNFE